MSSAQTVLRVLRLIVLCLELNPYARLFMRPIRLHLLHFQKPSSRDLKHFIPITSYMYLVEHQKWWLKRTNTFKGRSLQSWEVTITFTTDASNMGFGGSQRKNYQGKWSKNKTSFHINHLEISKSKLHNAASCSYSMSFEFNRRSSLQ